MSLERRLNDDLKTAMKSGDAVRRSVIQMVRSQILLEKKKKAGDAGELDDAQVMRILHAQLKQLSDACEHAEKAGRGDLVEAARREQAIVESYLPQPLDDAELHEMVRAVVAEQGASGVKAMGAVMKEVLARGAGRVDGRRAQEAVKKALETS